MKLIAVVALLVIVATPLVRGQSKARQGGRPFGTAEEEIRRLHLEVVQAQLTSDIATLDHVWANDHSFTNPLGVVQTAIA